MVNKNSVAKCLRFTEDKIYSVVFDDEGNLIVKETDGKRGGYTLRKVGATRTHSTEEHPPRITVIFSFEELQTEGD